MAVVIPFKALRPYSQYVKEVASCPYDVVTAEEARKIAAGNPLSFLRVEKSEIETLSNSGIGGNNEYEIAALNLNRLIQGGALFQEKTACFYVYRQKMVGHEQYGIVGGISVAEYESGRLKKHELTRTDKEMDRIRHIDTVNAQTGPVFVTYNCHETIDRIVGRVVMNQPEYDFTADDGVSHTVWIINDEEEIRNVANEFSQVEALYIADGHHRAAAAAAVGKMRREAKPNNRGDEAYNYIMAVLFPHDQLKIMEYNRVVRDIRPFPSEGGFFDKISEKFTINGDFREKTPGRPGDFGMYLGGRWCKLTWRGNCPEEDNPIGRLDVSILQNHLLGPVLGIRDVRTDGRIEFVGGIRGCEELEKLVASGEFAVAFSLYPVNVLQLMEVVDTGGIMPPKSTWFAPKPASGIFVYPFD
ncbi:MAG: DUF1015 family protein [Syntrophales bacterium]|nr:DUF1015 family protein [Syntrophales bacterium]